MTSVYRQRNISCPESPFPSLTPVCAGEIVLKTYDNIRPEGRFLVYQASWMMKDLIEEIFWQHRYRLLLAEHSAHVPYGCHSQLKNHGNSVFLVF